MSVIIPSYNCIEGLLRTLQALGEQTLACDAFEVIVVDDGSVDGSADRIAGQEFPYCLRLIEQANRGPGAARNLGARSAGSEILIFLDADMIPDRVLVQEYLLAHHARPGSIVMGRIRVWAEANRSLFDQIARVEETRDLGPDPVSLTFYHVVSCNFSLWQNEFRALSGFDETLRESEDTDLGYRAERMGVPLVYWPAAVAYHDHPRTFQGRCAQVRSSAFWTAKHIQKHPAIIPLLPIYQEILPIAWGRDSTSLIVRKLGRRVFSLTLTRKIMELSIRVLEKGWPNPALLKSLYYKTMSGYRVEGLREGLRRTSA